MERSFADLFKRLEKYKDVVQGYKKVGVYKHVLSFSTLFVTQSRGGEDPTKISFETLSPYLGFFLSPQNEETLKACAQDYLVRIKKEEQRYQTLKVHAEEKIQQ